MRVIKFIANLFVFLLLTLTSCQKDTTNPPVKKTDSSKSNIHLTAISADQSGIHFNNEIKEQPNLNFFVWNFLYTGAGVAAGDLNNDGLPDLFFGGNLVDDKIYFNKGDFKFEDVTIKTGINATLWTTGVTMADVNGDGFLDIYVCKNSPTAVPANNQNKLWINNRNGTFTEQASAYGIADAGFSIQASFFDFDNDGDLDLYLVNQPFDDYARRVNNPEAVINYALTDRLFVMENGKYSDKTDALNMRNSKFGLGLSLGDFDLDGWTDFYVCNDYHFADHLYMNKGGTFKDEIWSRTGHTSFYSMGSDVADINNDGQLDLLTLDMAFQDHFRSKTNMESMNPERFWQYVNEGRHYQYPFNNLQINQGDGTFKEVAQLSGIAKTDWSASPLFVDLDANGQTDLLITNGVLKDLKNNDFSAKIQQRFNGQIGPAQLQEALSLMPSNPIPNMLFQNNGNLQFDEISKKSGFDFKGFSHGMAYADFDQDGKLDIAINNMNAKAGIYKNTSSENGHYLMVKLNGPEKNRNGLGATIIAYEGNSKQVATMQTTRGFLSSSEPVVHFGFGEVTSIDSLKVIWNHETMAVFQNVKTDQTLTVQYRSSRNTTLNIQADKKIELTKANVFSYMHEDKNYNDFAKQVLLPYKLSQNGPFIAKSDLNNDGFEDVFIGASSGYPSKIFQQTADGVFSEMTQPDLEKDQGYEDMEASFVDFNSDGFVDLFVSSGSNELSKSNGFLQSRIYFNDGKGRMINQNALLPTTNNINGQCHVVFDADGDQDLDLFIGGRLTTGQYLVPTNSALWINDAGKWKDETKERAGFLADLGLVTDAIAEDLDADGDLDIVVVGEWMQPTILLNEENKTFKKMPIAGISTGLWWSIDKGDFDKDGDMDLLIGNLGWNNKFGGSKPAGLEIYSNDFDGNGDYDVVLATNKGAKTYPVRGRECSSQEMPFILNKFPTYESFGQAELKDILSADQLKNSLHKKIETFSSVILKNEGQLNFTATSLPVECQMGPIKSFEIQDLNKDGHLDFIFGGNHFPTEVETARYDGLSLGFCYGKGDGTFNHTAFLTDELMKTMDVRDLEFMELKNGKKLLLIANNQSELEAYFIMGE